MAAGVALGVFSLPGVRADTFGSGANQFTMDFVTIGHPGNPADTTGVPNPVGAVSYVFKMAVHEVSRDMILKANEAGDLGITLFGFHSLTAGDLPASGISWFEAARFVNWLNTSSGHAPAYNFDADGKFGLWDAEVRWTLGGENAYRNRGARYFLPSDDEWYKAAFFDGSVYFDFATGSDAVPTPVTGGFAAGTAVYGQTLPADIYHAGGLSPFGTMAQGGNASEWQESASDGVNDHAIKTRGLRGGYWGTQNPSQISASFLDSHSPGFDLGDVGFRVAAVPEPAVSAGVFGFLALTVAGWRRFGVRAGGGR